MMAFIGLVLLIVYIIGIVNGGWFIKLSKENKETIQEKLDKMGEKERLEYSLTLLAKALMYLTFSITMLILKIVFLIGALSVDVILVPTILLLTIFVFKFVLVSTSKKYRERVNNQSEDKRKLITRWDSFFSSLYVIYILKLLIIS